MHLRTGREKDRSIGGDDGILGVKHVERRRARESVDQYLDAVADVVIGS